MEHPHDRTPDERAQDRATSVCDDQSGHARHQRAWRSQRRFLFLCAESPGIGSYFKMMTTAYSISVAMHRALVIGCKEAHMQHGHAGPPVAASSARFIRPPEQSRDECKRGMSARDEPL